MIEPSSIKWIHRTQQGSERTENKDCFSIINSDLGTWVFVIDISTSSIATTELAKRFSEHFHVSLQNLLKDSISAFTARASQEKTLLDSYFADVENRKQVIQQAFSATKKELRIGVASFLALYRNDSSNKVYGLCAGDCRLGVLNNKSIQWLSPVHTGANPSGNDFENSMSLLPERHILTKSLNLRRKFEPEVFELDTSIDDVFVVATDGFWMELDEAQQQSFINEPDVCLTDKYLVDDTSVLLVTWSALEQEFEPKFECGLSLEFTPSPKKLTTQTNENLLIIDSISSDFSSNANITATSTNIENKNEY
jgi:serine/threonine protein phosphatase PrpC